jgi:hypothetical protein
VLWVQNWDNGLNQNKIGLGSYSPPLLVVALLGPSASFFFPFLFGHVVFFAHSLRKCQIYLILFLPFLHGIESFGFSSLTRISNQNI